jgi:hypothetical protein
MSAISPGVYSKITDLSTYVQAVPGTIGLICSLTRKGEDNVLKFFGSRSEYIAECGEPNIAEFGKNYGQGPYLAYNFLGESGALFHTRCMPDDASYANMRIDADMGAADATASIIISHVEATDANSQSKLITKLAVDGDVYPICILRPIGRGESYNSLSVRFTEHANPMYVGIYTLDIYEKQSDGSEVIIESFEVSFSPNAKDTAGDSIWIVSTLAKYSSVLRCEMVESDETYTPGYDLVVKNYDKEIGTVDVTLTAGTALITDSKQNFVDWKTDAATYEYCITAIDQRGNRLYGWLGPSSGDNDESIAIFDGRLAGAAQNWIGNTSDFDDTGEITYIIQKSFTSITSGFTSADPVPLRKGTEGTLLNADGSLNTTVAKQMLQQGYLGQLTSPIDGLSLVEDILDLENIYFTLVFDCGYPSDVKTSISTLVQTRRDCVAIMDNGDNSSYNAAMTTRHETHTFNNYFCSLYESYNKISDTWTGQDIWVSPVYHMSYLLPRNDNVAEIWWAAAGFNRAAIDTIKELRYNPRLGQRDQMYLKQLNPIVKFNVGYTVWGQLTSQAKASAMQDLNIVRLVLYVKRALEQYCRYHIFQMNDAITWSTVAGDMLEFLEDIKKRRGLYSYNIEVSATPYEIKRKVFHVNIILEATKIVERVELNFFIK